MPAASTTKASLAVFAGLSLAGTLAGCSAAADAGAGGAAADTRAVYTDGEYSAEGSYQAPSGTESVDVTLTLAGNIITAVEVVGNATDPTAKLRQGEFISGIAGVVVGKDINSITVDKVGGSSLTSGGFNKAVEEIKADAAA
ncbi:MAG: hypothetical protein ACKVOG_13085 [Rhodoglobus sp.]